jgi:branched-chain amino acid aminotransferase
VIQIAQDLGYVVEETNLIRSDLYIADEIFMPGTAAEVTPVRSIDKIKIGEGKRGPVTAALQSAFFAVVNGDVPDSHGWLTYVYPDDAGVREASKAGAAKG